MESIDAKVSETFTITYHNPLLMRLIRAHDMTNAFSPESADKPANPR